MSNIFDEYVNQLHSLEEYVYRLVSYQISHSELVLQATNLEKKDETVKIYFADVYYIQMPRMWTGDLRLASAQEGGIISEQIGLELAGAPAPSLFKAETSHTPVYILGTLVDIN